MNAVNAAGPSSTVKIHPVVFAVNRFQEIVVDPAVRVTDLGSDTSLGSVEASDILAGAAVVLDGRGRAGYLLKDRVLDIDEFVDALERVAAGETVVDPALVAQLLDRARKDNPLDQLTCREREVLSGRYRSATGLGRGLLGVKRLADRFNIRTSKSGTHVEAEVNL